MPGLRLGFLMSVSLCMCLRVVRSRVSHECLCVCVLVLPLLCYLYRLLLLNVTISTRLPTPAGQRDAEYYPQSTRRRAVADPDTMTEARRYEASLSGRRKVSPTATRAKWSTAQ